MEATLFQKRIVRVLYAHKIVQFVHKAHAFLVGQDTTYTKMNVWHIVHKGPIAMQENA